MKVYALKQSHTKIKKKGFLKKFSQEVKMLSKLEHNNIVRYHTSFVDDENHFCILMEFCGRDLAACFESKVDIRTIIKPQALKIFSDMICAIEYMHRQSVIHRDIKPGNVFISLPEKVCHAKIGDFGLACCQDDALTSVTGTALYRAPEQDSEKYNLKVDMFPCGMILFELLKIEWEDPEEEHESEWIDVLKGLRRKTEEALNKFRPFHPEGVEQLIRVLLDRDPERRPNASQVSIMVGKLTCTSSSGKLILLFRNVAFQHTYSNFLHSTMLIRPMLISPSNEFLR